MEVSINSDKIVVVKRGQVVFIPLEDIYYIERLNQCSFIKSKGNKVPVRVPLKKLEELLPSNFVRSHRAFIINKSCLQELIKQDENNYEATFFDTEKTAIVSKTYLNSLFS
ncbi:LytTR family DNA-binding domain-containing protein [Domibacillus sp. DTU_2020_1001157_1_SI_ALB_TIR_016]|uniref:LytR/AlgR family response regulator transcription factor n=1 Tax=Domibacillus sp. DTU_2020_1001157_1_SI_ALB_TIR_016 TaxID=3077789 RepID=UPI0028E78C8C|nr:LytTR family DNA-binding domain-containing protein [Domibacillus sp. DTU_2020_1001157_1_SI_ALB_TIR_016]WNS78710.1 LytTR family DNA-binding domain-containing protein [Domibacillus sp. DTU_2020_1001157_1_SI_ALB_TIR_016]